MISKLFQPDLTCRAEPKILCIWLRLSVSFKCFFLHHHHCMLNYVLTLDIVQKLSERIHNLKIQSYSPSFCFTSYQRNSFQFWRTSYIAWQKPTPPVQLRPLFAYFPLHPSVGLLLWNYEDPRMEQNTPFFILGLRVDYNLTKDHHCLLSMEAWRFEIILKEISFRTALINKQAN